MTKQQIQDKLLDLFSSLEGNVITPEQAGENPVAGLTLFQSPLMGVGSADDPLFETFREKSVVGPWFMGPREWLPDAQTVLSFFFPFTKEVCDGEARSLPEDTSPEWLFGRIEGQQFLIRVLDGLCSWLAGQGAGVCMPAGDPRFAAITAGESVLTHPEISSDTFSSNWSERHAAYVCGLGTFSLTRAVITEKGCAGRFGSIITDLKLDPTPRRYTGIYDYCTRCGACVRQCPVQAISLEQGKQQLPCRLRSLETQRRYSPRYGCGKCQTKLPCQDRIPNPAARK